MQFDLAADRAGFIGYRVFPLMSVAKSGGSFGKITLESLLQNRETARNARAAYSRGDWEFDDDSFSTVEHGTEEVVDDRESKLYAEYFDAEQISAERALDAVLRNAEKRIADAVFNATTFTSYTAAVSVKWSVGATATPIDDVDTAIAAIWAATGLWPNSLIINRHVFRNLRKCDQIIERIESSGAGSATKARDITTQMLAQAFDLDNIIVAGGAKNIANEGQDRSIANIWSSDYAMIGRICTTNDIREPGLGRTFHWDEDGGAPGGTIETYRDERVRGDVVRARHDVDEKLLYTQCGYLLSNIT
jgi:hypothetical protein